MKTVFRIVLLLCALAAVRTASAQYYTWGADAPMKWSTIRTPEVRMIYPDTVSALAMRTLHSILTVRSDISHGFTHGPMRIPFVMHPENFRSNGLVMYLPKRVEFLTSPAIESYSMPWYKQLVVHEYRHAVQYNNLNRGVIRALSYALGQQGSTVGLLCMPIWAMEGDAVMSETQMSTFGRGLQPSFTIGYRAMGNIAHEKRNIDKWFCGSYRDYVPDHYQLGYQICAYAYDRYGENIWDKVARYGSRNPYVLATTRAALGKYYRTDVRVLFRNTFDELNAFWDSLPASRDSAETLTEELPPDNYTTYRWPLPLNDTTVLALKSDYDRPARFVRIDPRTGHEQTLCRTGDLSTRPALDDGRIWWTEYRRSKLFEQRINSQLCYLDLANGRPHAVKKARRVLYPTPGGDGLGWVEYAPDGRYTVVATHPERPREQFATPDGSEIHGLAWDDRTAAWYAIVTDDTGMWLGRIDAEGLHAVTRGAYITLSDLRAEDGWLYYGSIASGRDEVHGYDFAARREYRLTTSAYGSFEPAPAKNSVLATTYDRRGYRVTRQAIDSMRMTPVEPARTPRNLVNPPRTKWGVVNLDTVRFTQADSTLQSGNFRRKRYQKVPNLMNVHSWMPAAFDPFAAVDEHRIDLNLGVTLLSQNLLSSTEAYASYGWNRAEGSLINLGIRYSGLGVRLDLDASYGGNQLFYSLMTYDPQTGNPIYQTLPAPDKYYSLGLSASLPLCLQHGYHTRWLTFSTGWNFSNGMVADLNKIEWNEGHISNIQRIGFRKGLHKLYVGASFSDQVQLAHRDFAPRWGYTLSAAYTFNPSNRFFSDLISLYGQVYLPGAVLHHSLRIAANYQTSIGGYKFPSGYAPLSYRSSRLIPRGFSSADIVSNNYTAAAIDYQMPVWYPEGGIGSVIYFKRIRLNIGGDYAQFRRPGDGGMKWRRIWSAGADIVLDINAFRQPASATSTVKLSFYRPSKGDFWFGASVGLPF